MASSCRFQNLLSCCVHPVNLYRPEAADQVHLDLQRAHLKGFNVQEVEPLLRRLEMTSLVKDLSKLQHLLGGAAEPDPELAAAVPAAVDKLADWIVQQQLANETSNSDTDDESSSSSGVTAAAAAGDKSRSPPTITGAVLAPRTLPLPDAVNSLPRGLLQLIPDVHVVTTQQQLQQFVARLQAHKVGTWGLTNIRCYHPIMQLQTYRFFVCQ